MRARYFALVASLLAVPVSVSADTLFGEAMLNLADANRDGNISSTEWKRMIRAGAASFSGQASACFERSRLKMFGLLDLNHDDRVSSQEWRDAGRRHFDPSLPDCSR